MTYTFFSIQCPKCAEWLLRELEDYEQIKNYVLKCVYCNRSSRVYSEKHGWRVNTEMFGTRQDALQRIRLMKDRKKMIYTDWEEKK